MCIRDSSCTVADGANPGTLSGTNTAKATWDKGAASTSEGSATGQADVVGELTGSVNASIDVTDPMAPAGTFTTFADSGSVSYDVVLEGTPGQCEQVGNLSLIHI